MAASVVLIDPAVSDVARTLRERFAARLVVGSSISLGRRLAALAELRAETEAGELDPTTVPPSADVFEIAEAFIQALPVDIPDPDIVPEPDGEIALDWQLGRRWVFSVSIGPRQRLSYAGLFGGSRLHGMEQFTGDIPESIRGALRRLLRGPLAAGSGT